MTFSFVIFAMATIFVSPSTALRCLECSGVETEAECAAQGEIRECRFNERACEIELREHEGWGNTIKIYKHCKQTWACGNNHVQNPRRAWSPTQCNPEDFNSVCRCCCFTDLCNIAKENCFGPTGCPSAPTYIHHGTISCTDGSNTFSKCTVTCDTNSRLTGSSTTYCRYDGYWSHPFGQCIDPQCPPKHTMVNGWYICTNANFEGSQCKPNCRPGYKLRGSNQINCVNGRWDYYWEPKCIPIQCPFRGRIRGGSVACTDGRNVQSRCKSICDENRRLVGVIDSYCQDDGTWSHPLPRCELIQCPPRGTIVNGVVSCDNGVEVSSACQAVCDEGYGIDGVADSVCLRTGYWSQPLPRCERIKCEKRGSVLYGKVSCTNTYFAGSVCDVLCDDGTRLIGTSSSECLDTGLWSVPLPTCKRVECPDRGFVDNGVVSCTNKKFVGSVCTVRCNSDYRVVGITVSECLITGEWSRPLPVCDPIVCEELDFSVEQGSMSCSNEFFYKSVCSFNCDPGYVLVGARRLNCLITGRWNTRMPTCRRIQCPPRGTILNGQVVCTDDREVDSECTASCNVGFEVVGQDTSICLPSGKWNRGLPRCTPITCPLRIRLVGGRIRCTNDNIYQSVCTAQCAPGFDLVGVTVSECLVTGRWDNPLPTCVEGPCNDQGVIEHGTITCTDDWNVDSICRFTCQGEGYRLQPAERNRNICRRGGEWNIPKPCCARPCPPYAIMDIVIVLDSSSSIGDANWISLTQFVEGIIGDFIIAPDAANFAIFRYNKEVDMDSQIMLNDHTDDSFALIEAFRRINYDGSGTFTGNGLRHALEVSLASINGNRPDVKDVVLVITDGKAADDVKTPADNLRNIGATILVLGIEPPRGALDVTQLNDIAGDPANLVIAEGGFQGLDSSFRNKLSDTICGDPCA